MNSPIRAAVWTEQARFGVILILVGACFLWGGGSRLDIPGLLFLQPIAIAAACALIIIPGPMRWNAVRVPMLLLGALALVMIVQLIPLPPQLWRALPGQEQLWLFIEATERTATWRPLSLTPDQTLASLVGLSVPAAALIGVASIPEERTHRLLACLLVAAGLSAAFGLAQLVGGPQSGFYRYAVTNVGAAVGLFSNRNHQAVLLAATWPMLALWMTRRGISVQQSNLRRWIGWSSGLALIPMVFATGSRAGVLLGVIGIGCAWWLLRGEARPSQEDSVLPPVLQRWWGAILIVAAFGITWVAILSSRNEALQRLFGTNVTDESRWLYLPVLWRIVVDFLPFGSGFGSFDPVFRYYEPNDLIDATYFNHAHNDLVELVITGGLPALAIAIFFLIWGARRAMALRGRVSASTSERFAFLGLTIIVLLLLASLADYPLRTPIHAMFFAFASAWLAAPRVPRRAPGQ